MACILHIETSTTVCSVAVSENGQCIFEQQERGEKGAGAERLGSMIDEALSFTDNHAIPFDAVSVSSGPGSYTGLRIGISMAKGICYGRDLKLIAESPDSGVSIVMAREGREFFITGHLEYAPNTLDTEYRRDKDIRDDVDLPKHYYLDDDPAKGPLVTWRAHANLLYANWINYYVYQETPYDINQIK